MAVADRAAPTTPRTAPAAPTTSGPGGAVGAAHATALLAQGSLSGDPTALAEAIGALPEHDRGFRDGFVEVLLAAVFRRGGSDH
jgi:hypothetical protein